MKGNVIKENVEGIKTRLQLQWKLKNSTTNNNGVNNYGINTTRAAKEKSMNSLNVQNVVLSLWIWLDHWRNALTERAGVGWEGDKWLQNKRRVEWKANNLA